MKYKHWKITGIFLILSLLYIGAAVISGPPHVPYNTNPPFKFNALKSLALRDKDGKTGTFYDPRDPYALFINYELGMHCVGFDISYCCVIPPYNSIQAQAVRTAQGGGLPHPLSPADGLTLAYHVRDNSYSEGNKMKYWQAPKDVFGSGRMDEPGANMANYVWTHLFIYGDLEGTLPSDWRPEQRVHVGSQIQIPVDSGPTGKHLAGGDLSYAGNGGGNKVFTDSLLPEVKNIPLTLTASYLWDALGLPLTAFNDSRRRGSLRTITARDYQPFQYAVVELRDKAGQPIQAGGKPVSFFGANPVDLPNCYVCHSGKGKAAAMARKDGLSLFDREYAYWKKNYPDVTDFTARQAQAAINVLEIHDRRFGTSFLREYNSEASSNRLGSVGPVYCADCHGDNISGNLQTPRPGATGYKAVHAKPLSEAVHLTHARFIPMPDKAGRTQSCQACHPSHWQQEQMNDPGINPYQIVDEEGNPRFSNSDVRIAGGGCYLRRDAHANPEVKPPFFLNEIGKWYLTEVSRKDEAGRPVTGLRGLYCTNCHNELAQALYRYDDLADAAAQEGRTLRNKPIREIVQALAQGDTARFKNFFADPVVGAPGDPLRSFYGEHVGATLARASRDSAGRLKMLAWNAKEGDPVPYDGASGGKDWWLAAGEPHCADCHLAPFVESEGGKYFPIDQPNKYALYRYSKAHGTMACQSCHESIHGLYPVRYEGPQSTVDLTTHEQALQFSPDGTYAGPVTCSACHRVNGKGVPIQLQGTPYANDYWASVTLLHYMREGDQKLPLAKLMEKYPYRKLQRIVEKGWE